MRILPLGPDPEVEKARQAEAEAAKARMEARDINALGLVAFQSREWDRAIRMFKRSIELDPSLEGIEENLNRSKQEKKYSSILKDGKGLLDKGDVDGALTSLAEVPESSVYYPEARQLMDSAGKMQINKEIAVIKTSLSSGRKKDAKSEYISLLERHPDDDAVIALRDELVEAGLRLEPIRRKAHAKPAEKQTVASTGWHSPPAGRRRAKTGSPRMDIAEALRLYERGSFQQAADQVMSIARHSKGSEAGRLRSIARRIEQFATAFNGGKTALESKRLDKAEQGLSLALRLDHGINGYYEPRIRGYLGDTYRGRAAAAIQNTDYVLAAKSARKALSYRPDDHLARTIMDKCLSVAARYYEQAAADIQNGERDAARRKLKMVLDMVPSGHQLADKASDLIKKTR
ncbi:MAG: hypothetical protein GXP54_12175 [Deltaproteobacteria bacterium]|nr:hypothetical protein [Deltaproteobacteria bacterium]